MNPNDEVSAKRQRRATMPSLPHRVRFVGTSAAMTSSFGETGMMSAGKSLLPAPSPCNLGFIHEFLALLPPPKKEPRVRDRRVPVGGGQRRRSSASTRQEAAPDLPPRRPLTTDESTPTIDVVARPAARPPRPTAVVYKIRRTRQVARSGAPSSSSSSLHVHTPLPKGARIDAIARARQAGKITVNQLKIN